MENKELFLEIVKQNVKRDGIDGLMAWLEKSDFYAAPASSRFHLSCESGLLQHSLHVYDRLVKLYTAEYGEEKANEDIEKLTIISLFHDLCKVHFYEVSFRNAKNEQGVWEKVPYYSVNEKLAFGYHGCKSAFLIERFMKLDVDEYTAVANHMGAYDRPNGDYSIGSAFEQNPLAFLLHTADCFASFIDEAKS